MPFKNLLLQGKLMLIVLLISVVAVVLMGGLFFASDLLRVRSEKVMQIGIGLVVLVLLVAYLLARSLQKQISTPMLSLAGTARVISERRDYSVRAPKENDDEIGRLADSFNQTLGEIEKLNREMEHRVAERTARLEASNAELAHQRTVFENLFESLPGCYLILTPDLKIFAVSNAYLKAVMLKRDALVGRHLFEVFPDNPKDAGANGASNLKASLNRVRETAAADTMAIQKYDVRRPDGVFEERYWSPVNSPLLGSDHTIQYLIHRVEDVTEFVRQKAFKIESDADMQMRMEKMQAEIFHSTQMVQAANQQLRAANAELESFSYSVSHDLRAPLRHIDGYTGLLVKAESEKLSDQGRGYLSHISDSAKHMGMLIDDLLLFSRVGRTEMNKSAVNLHLLLDETRQVVQRDEGQKRTINWRISPLPTVYADRSMLRQVFVNLLSNAVKYTRPREPAEIEVGCFDEAEEVVVFVRDNGVGFEMQYAQKLFGVFQRLHRAEEFEGTGIGLANVRRIITRHGGRTWAESVLDTGATFYFSLPKHYTPQT